MQFEYGGDGLEPASMEGAEWPVEFGRILNSVKVLIMLSNTTSLSDYRQSINIRMNML